MAASRPGALSAGMTGNNSIHRVPLPSPTNRTPAVHHTEVAKELSTPESLQQCSPPALDLQLTGSPPERPPARAHQSPAQPPAAARRLEFGGAVSAATCSTVAAALAQADAASSPADHSRLQLRPLGASSEDCLAAAALSDVSLLCAVPGGSSFAAVLQRDGAHMCLRASGGGALPEALQPPGASPVLMLVVAALCRRAWLAPYIPRTSGGGSGDGDGGHGGLAAAYSLSGERRQKADAALKCFRLGGGVPADTPRADLLQAAATEVLVPLHAVAR